jgi:hypothetical protein
MAMEMDAIQTAIYTLLEKFVERQKIPYEVIKKYRAFFVDPSQRRSHDKEYWRSTALGFWGDANEWKYFLHGAGCHVTHIETGEVIGWDAATLTRFDPYWLADWIHWYAAYHPDDPLSLVVAPLIANDHSDTAKNLFPILDQLHQLGKLSYDPTPTNKYELIREANT